MSTVNVRISTDPDRPSRGTLEINGQDIANGVGSAQLTIGGGQIPTLDLRLLTAPVEFTGAVNVRMTPATIAALLALGWTPPADRPDEETA